jgi:Family of unknown function (DUF5995)
MCVLRIPLLIILPCLTAGCRMAAPPPPPVPVPLSAQARHIMQSLESGHREFLLHGTPEKVFAVFYHHVTRAILHRVQQGETDCAPVIIELLEEFHADYLRNQNPATRTAAWARYYEKAASLHTGLRWRGIIHPGDFTAPRSLLALAVTAHIDGDLPHCLTRVLRRHPELRGSELLRLEAAFRSLDDLFQPCSAAGFADLATRTPDAPGAAVIALQSRAARALILRKRHRAWHTAVQEITSR